jgi:hypothetical protein
MAHIKTFRHLLHSYNVAVTPISKPNAQRGTLQLGATRRLLLVIHRAATMSRMCRQKRTSPALFHYLVDVGGNRRRSVSSGAHRGKRRTISLTVVFPSGEDGVMARSRTRRAGRGVCAAIPGRRSSTDQSRGLVQSGSCRRLFAPFGFPCWQGASS